MTKTIMIASLALAVLASVSADVAAVELKNASYFCTVEFAAGLKFNQSLKKWESTTFRPDYKFVLKLQFLSEKTENDKMSRNSYSDAAYFIVTITPGGTSDSIRCLKDDNPRVPVSRLDDLLCTFPFGISEYRFNLKTNRFLQYDKNGYVYGWDNDTATPSVSGGICTKID